MDPASFDAAEWALRALTAFCDVAFRSPPNAIQEALEESVGAALGLPGIGSDPHAGLLRAYVLLMALFEVDASSSERIDQLAAAACSEAAAGVSALALRGLRIDPFRGETTAERGARLIRYANSVGARMTKEDHEALQAARMTDLR